MSKSLIFLSLLSFMTLFSCTKTEVPDRLIGIEMQYIYDNENDLEFALKFTEEGVKYQYKNGTKPNKWWGPFPHNYTETESGEHLVSWFEANKGDYVTLLINFDKKILYGSGILYPKKKVHFHKAEIIRLEIP